MKQEKIDRINELARFAKERELSEAEAAERAVLREEYLSEWRRSVKDTLDNTYIVGPDGVRRKLKRKDDGKGF